VPPNRPITDSLRFVASQLRVPEIKYVAIDEQECRDITRRFLQSMNDSQEASVMALSDARQLLAPQDRFSVRAMNLMFIVDRCFDVWLRKSSLDKALQRSLLSSRSQVFSIAYMSLGESKQVEAMAGLLDAMSSALVGWCENPERAKKQVPQLVDDTLAALCGSLSLDAIVQANTRWKKYWQEAAERKAKITQRLVLSESDVVAKQFGDAFAQAYINKQFSSRALSPVVQRFLNDQWFRFISNVQIEMSDKVLPEPVTLLGKKMRAVFCDKGKAAFRYGETLVEDLVEEFDRYNVAVAQDVWQVLSDEIIAIFKGQPSQEQVFIPIEIEVSLDSLEPVSPRGYQEGDWLIDESTFVRAEVLKIFGGQGQALLINHLGMKLERISISSLNRRVQERVLKKLPAPVSYTSVLSTTLSGLEKVAKAQLVAREKAAKKALDEAAALKAEQDAAAQNVRQKAEEIARRTKEIVDRKEEAQRLDRERVALEKVSSMALGAWVSIEADDGKQRFKLAVKFAARKRYVFVDKYGIKKREYHEPELIADILNERLVILSDGADFDDSLERVIGRIRMSG